MRDKILETYSWLTEKFVTGKIEKYEAGSTVAVKSFDVESLLEQGENFCSNMLRLRVTYFVNADNAIEKEISFIIKAPIPNDEFVECSSELDAFERESFVYVEIISKAEKLLKSVGIHEQFAPRFYNDPDETDFLVLEDLTSRKYQNVDKTHGLDFEHLKTTLKKVARWHAATATLGVTHPNLVSKPIPLAEIGNVFVRNYIENAIEGISTVAKHWQGFEHITADLLSCKNRAFAEMCKQAVCDPEEFNVFHHSDLWSNNIMFRCEQGKPIDVIFVDYAFGYWGPIARDIAYLFFSSSHRSVNEYEWDKLLQCYHSELKTILLKLNYPKKIPTMNDIQVSFLRSAAFPAVVGMSIMAAKFLKKLVKDGLLSFVGQDESDKQFLAEMYSDPECEDLLKRLLDYYDRKGIFSF